LRNFFSAQQKRDLASEKRVVARQFLARAAQPVDHPAAEACDDDEDAEMREIGPSGRREAVGREKEAPQGERAKPGRAHAEKHTPDRASPGDDRKKDEIGGPHVEKLEEPG